MIRCKNVMDLATNCNISEYDTVIFSYRDQVVEIVLELLLSSFWIHV